VRKDLINLIIIFWKLFLPIASVVCEVGMSWVKRFVEAFMRTVLPDPEKTGEQLGSWVLSCFGLRRK